MSAKLAAIVFPLALLACAPAAPGFVASMPEAPPAMTYEECKGAQVCTATGRIRVIESDRVAMGELDLGDGKCITLSLSRNDIRYVRGVGSVAATVSGRVYRGHHDPNYILLEIQGRKVGYPHMGRAPRQIADQPEAGNTSDFKAAVMAFLQKRQPDFEGRWIAVYAATSAWLSSRGDRAQISGLTARRSGPGRAGK